MKLVTYDTAIDGNAYDVFKGQLVVDETAKSGSENTFDFASSENQYKTYTDKAAEDAGLFILPIGGTNNTKAAKDTKIIASMETSPLSFVTTQSSTTGTIDEKNGVQLLTVVYTVAIDDSKSIDEVLPTANTKTSDHAAATKEEP